MKKKRDDNRKKRAGNSSDVNGGSASNISGIGCEFGNFNSPQNDYCHNTHTPCSVFIMGIAGEIFPTLHGLNVSKSEADGLENKNKATNKEKAAVKNNGQNNGKLNGKPQLNIDCTNESKCSTSLDLDELSQSKKQSLLGNIILQRLISDRKRARDQNSVSITVGGNDFSTNNDSPDAKKKKKKKRKKKNGGGATATSSVSSLDGVDDDGEGDITDDVKDGAPSAAATTMASASSSAATQSVASRASNEHGQIVSEAVAGHAPTPFIDTTSSFPPAPGAGETDGSAPTTKPSTSSLDVFLDSIIESDKVPDAIPNRDLDSFSDFLARKYLRHIREYIRQYQQQQNSNEKLKGGGRKDAKENSVPHAKSINEYNLSTDEFAHFMPCMEFRDIVPTVPLSDVKQNAELIACRQCRTAALHYLRNHGVWLRRFKLNYNDGLDEEFDVKGGRKTLKKLRLRDDGVGNVDTPEVFLAVDSFSSDLSTSSEVGRLNGSGRSHGGLCIPVDDDFDHAFDYMAFEDSGIDLEAGQTESKETNHDAKNAASFRVEMYPVHDADPTHCLQMKAAVSCKTTKGMAQFPYSSDDIIRLIRNIILPFGMKEAQFSHDHSDNVEQSRPQLSDRDFNIISSEAKDLLNEVKVAFAAPGQLLQDLRSEMDGVKESNTRTHFDSYTAAKLHELDNQCDGSVVALGKALLTFTRMCCYVGWSSEYGPYLMKNLIDSWKKFDNTLQTMVKPVMEHRGNRVGVEGRPGAVPHAYLSAAVRSSLEKTVGFKLECVESLYQSLNNLILGAPLKACKEQLPGHAPSVMLILSVVHSYYKCVHRDQNKCVFPSEEIENQVRDFIDARISLAQKTTISTSPEQMKSKEKEMYDNVRQKDGLVFDLVEAHIMDVTGEESPLKFLRDGYDRHEAIRVECDKEHHLLAAKSIALDDYHLDHADVTLLLKKSHATLMQLIYLICMRQHKNHPGKRTLISSRLKYWMESANGSQYASTDEAKDDGESENCDGRASSDGRRRINSIVSTFLYRWLEARCSEWHAELTQDELLRSMEMDVSVPTASEGGTKPSKKKKSKRKAGMFEKLKDKGNANVLVNEINNTIVSSKEEVTQETTKNDYEHDPNNAEGNSPDSAYRLTTSADYAGITDEDDAGATEAVPAKVKKGETVTSSSIGSNNGGKPKTVYPKNTLGGVLAKKSVTQLCANLENNSIEDSHENEFVKVNVQSNIDKKSGKETFDPASMMSGKESADPVQQSKLEKKSEVETTETSSGKEFAQSANQPQLIKKSEGDTSENSKTSGKKPAKVEETSSEEQSIHDLKKDLKPSIGRSSQDEMPCDAVQKITQCSPVDDFIEWHSIVGVDDSKEFIPAETFLMGRMETILASRGIDSLPSSKKVRIVRL
ncbi:hypothetical protein ACHAXS_010136 [Conticribra weissflogii]